MGWLSLGIPGLGVAADPPNDFAKEQTLQQIRDGLKANPNVKKTTRADLYETIEEREKDLDPKDKTTYTNILDKFSKRVKDSELLTAATNFFDLESGGGGCPTWQGFYFGITLVFDQFCSPVAESAFAIMSWVLPALAGWLAIKIAWL